MAGDLLHDLAHLLRPVFGDWTVAPTLQRPRHAPFGELQDLRQTQAQSLNDFPLNAQAVGGGIQTWRFSPVIPYVEELIRGDLVLQGRRWGRKGAPTLVGRDQLRLCCDNGLLHTPVSLCVGDPYSSTFVSS